MVIGVSGKYCSGKNRLCSLLEARGWKQIDVDKLGHRALVEKRGRVTAEFGTSILAADGSIDRQRLGRIVFSGPRRMRRLEAIIHPLMYTWTEESCAVGSDTVINAAMLYRMQLYRLCDRVIWVSAPLSVRIQRAMQRDGLSLFKVLKRTVFQRKLKSKHLRRIVDIYTIRNDGKTDLSSELDSFLESI
ncbi:MAG: dephospho-CoA kinase [Spirochaetales bacterium]|nr:dephospho-CoA kinase [Spirochaetales bacterium]